MCCRRGLATLLLLGAFAAQPVGADYEVIADLELSWHSARQYCAVRGVASIALF